MGIACTRMGAEACDHQLGRGIDADHLSMHAARGEGTVLIVCDPPHIAV